MKRVRLRVLGRTRVLLDGKIVQELKFILRARGQERSVAVHLEDRKDERFPGLENRSLARWAWSALRKAWRDEVLGAGWQRRSALRRHELGRREFEARYPGLAGLPR